MRRLAARLASNGLNTCLRDLALVGQLLLSEGVLYGSQVILASAVANIRQDGSKEAFTKAGYKLLPGWSYRSMWWITHTEHGAYMARGVHGQAQPPYAALVGFILLAEILAAWFWGGAAAIIAGNIILILAREAVKTRQATA